MVLTFPYVAVQSGTICTTRQHLEEFWELIKMAGFVCTKLTKHICILSRVHLKTKIGRPTSYVTIFETQAGVVYILKPSNFIRAKRVSNSHLGYTAI